MDALKLVVFIATISFTSLAEENVKLKCKPKKNCDFSHCDPIPPNLLDLQGFDADEYRKQEDYHIECQLNSDLLSKGEPDGQGLNRVIGGEIEEPAGRSSRIVSGNSAHPEDIENLAKRMLEMEARQEAKIVKLEKKIKDLETRIPFPRDCSEVQQNSAKLSDQKGGLFDIYPDCSCKKLEVYCDLETDDGGWTVFQRRKDGSEDFNRNWQDYVDGFGRKNGEMWLGLETIYDLTKDGNYELRIELEDWNGKTAYAKYGKFAISDSSKNYQLEIGDYTGNAGDSLNYHNGQKFSTRDKDNDPYSALHCGKILKSGWWFNRCSLSRLNGVYHEGGKYSGRWDDGVVWYTWKADHYYSLKFTEMKFRRKKY